MLLIWNPEWNKLNYEGTYKVIWEYDKEVMWKYLIYVIIDKVDVDKLKLENINIEILKDLPRWAKIYKSDYPEDINKKILKRIVRNRITEEVWDLEDLLADLSKRVSLLERLIVIRLYYDLKWWKLPKKYKEVLSKYVEVYMKKYNNWEIKDLVDIEDVNELLEKLITRITKITEIVVEEYFKYLKDRNKKEKDKW